MERDRDQLASDSVCSPDTLLDAICDRFESAWKQGPARIEDFLTEIPAVNCARLFSELLALEIDILRQRCDAPDVNDYQQRFPEYASVVRQRLEVTVVAAAGLTPSQDGRATPSVSPEREPSSAARFRILRPYAEGGPGIVSVARDEELGRDVALKEIKPRHAHHADSRARFMLEAEVTGGLEHPGIVPVYGLGRFADGRPYYAMRFVHGQSLQEAVQLYHGVKYTHPSDRSVELRKLLRRFLDVCETVAYAHSRGVLHRDIKPANIILGQFGETLVVDWGLAKLLDRADLASEPNLAPLQLASGSSVMLTRMDSTIGTPQYMSPEQAAGQTDRVGTASDVYSLGATLYSILTGKPPVAGEDLECVLAKVKQGDIARPRQLRPETAAPLEAICLKAMAKQPDERYASAKALSKDVERWLADEEVAAYRDPISARLSRWARRHKVATAAVVVLLLTAVVALSVGTVLLGREQARTEKARLLAQTNLDQAEDARRAAEAAKLREQQAAASARENYDSLYAVFHSALGVQQNLAANGEYGIRRQLLESSLAGLEKLAANAREQKDNRVSRNVFGVLTELGDLVAREGDESGHNNIELSRTCFERSLQLALQLVQDDPKDIAVKYQLSLIYERLGGLSRTSGDWAISQKYYQLNYDTQTQLTRAMPKNADMKRALWVSVKNLGDASLNVGDAKSALEWYRKELELAQQLTLADPQSLRAKCDLSVTYSQLGGATFKLGELAAARKYYEQAATIEELLPRAGQHGPATSRALPLGYAISDYVFANSGLGDVSAKEGDTAGARKFYERSLSVSQQWMKLNPHDLQVFNDLLSPTFRRLGELCDQSRDDSGSERFWKQRIAVDQRLADADAHNVMRKTEVLLDYRNLAGAEKRLSHFSDAKHWYEAARDELAQLEQVRHSPELSSDAAAITAGLKECDESLIKLKPAGARKN